MKISNQTTFFFSSFFKAVLTIFTLLLCNVEGQILNWNDYTDIANGIYFTI